MPFTAILICTFKDIYIVLINLKKKIPCLKLWNIVSVCYCRPPVKTCTHNYHRMLLSSDRLFLLYVCQYKGGINSHGYVIIFFTHIFFSFSVNLSSIWYFIYSMHEVDFEESSFSTSLFLFSFQSIYVLLVFFHCLIQVIFIYRMHQLRLMKDYE